MVRHGSSPARLGASSRGDRSSLWVGPTGRRPRLGLPGRDRETPDQGGSDGERPDRRSPDRSPGAGYDRDRSRSLGHDTGQDLQEDDAGSAGGVPRKGRSSRVPADRLGPTLEGWPGPELGDEVGTDAGDPLPGPEPGAYAAARRKLGKALVPGETILVAQTRHPVVVLEPVLTSLLALLFIAAVSPGLGDLDLLRNAMMLGWLALAVRALLRWLHWTNDYLVVTDRRLMRLHGIIDVQRDMMPLMKVTDMSFERPFLGRPLNYGTFVLESAGRDQALREINFVRRPAVVDAIIGRQIFARPPSAPPPKPRR